ncbi:hypothetical protein LMIY3S_04568 [Labrys miyagiensis]
MRARASSLAGRARHWPLPLLGLWTAAAAIMLAVHGGAIWAARDWHPVEPPPKGDPQIPIEIDTPPPPEPAPPQLPQEAVPEVEPDQVPDTQADTVQPVEPEPVPNETPPPEPTPIPPDTVQEATPAEPDPVPPEDVQAEMPPEPEPEAIPETPEAQQAEVVLPPVARQEKKERKQPPRKQPVRPRIQQPRPQPQLQRPQPAVDATPEGRETAGDLQAWRIGVRARVARVTSGRGGTTRGRVTVVLRISGSGQVLSISTSGPDAGVTTKARSLVQGIGSVSSPPDGKPQTVPVTLIFK